MKWIVTKTYKYTETVEVDAETRSEAEEIAKDTDGRVNCDDWLYDFEVEPAEYSR